jgi:SNF2 family DNA or RNA helicase
MDNHDWLKKHTRSELLRELVDVVKSVKNFNSLWTHQLVCFLLVDAFDRFMLHIDMGGGKTGIALFSILYRKQLGLKPKAIVFVPYVTAVDTWIEECKKHTPQLKLVPLIGSTIDNRRLIEEGGGDVYVICYASSVAMLSEKAPD